MFPCSLGWLVLLAATPLRGALLEPARAAQAEIAELQLRDARLSFTGESARRARAVLESGSAEGESGVEERAVALLALGCGGAGGDVARIEARLESGVASEGSAALFALGELGVTGWPALERAFSRDTAGLEEPLCVALALAARGGASPAEERLRALAAGADETARRAAQALAWRAGDDPQGLSETLALYFELRWRAARSFGLVDGRRGAESRRAELFTSEEFLERVVLAAAAELPAAALEAHVREILDAGERPGTLRAAALAMPVELEHAIREGEWKPSEAGWRTVLAAIDDARSELRAKGLLGLAFRSAPALEPLAGLLLFRGGSDLSWSWVSDQLEKGDPESRARLIEACGDRGEKELIPDLEALILDRPELGLAGAARVALVRLGHPPARKELEALLAGTHTSEREQVLESLAEVLHDERLWRYAEQALERADLPGHLRLELQAGLACNGASVDRTELRRDLRAAVGREERQACLRALAHRPDVADLEVLGELFPFGDDLELDVELALALLTQRHPATGGLLASALWSPDWNLSVQAGGLIVASAGTQGLLDELDAAPRSAGERDLRRVGFSLGEWGGLSAVELLARARSEGDPVLQGALLGALASRAAGGGEVALPDPRVELEFPDGGEGAPKGGAKPKGKPKGKPGGKPKRGRPKAGG